VEPEGSSLDGFDKDTAAQQIVASQRLPQDSSGDIQISSFPHQFDTGKSRYCIVEDAGVLRGGSIQEEGQDADEEALTVQAEPQVHLGGWLHAEPDPNGVDLRAFTHTCSV